VASGFFVFFGGGRGRGV